MDTGQTLSQHFNSKRQGFGGYADFLMPVGGRRPHWTDVSNGKEPHSSQTLAAVTP